jgi:RNA polymerase sigma-70 factor (ECF subfamily)
MRFRSRLASFAIRSGVYPQDAGIVVDEVMMAVWNGAAKFRGDAQPHTWITGIAKRRIADWHRKTQRTKSDVPYEEGESDDPENGVEFVAVESPHRTEQQAEQSELRGKLMEAIAKAPLRQRAVLVKMFFEGLAVSEIAAQMDIAEGTVKATLSQAKQAMRKQLEKDGFTWGDFYD